MDSNNSKSENISFFLDDSELETNISLQLDVDYTKEILVNLEENTCNKEENDFEKNNYPHFLNYQINYTVKQLLLICEYYDIQITNKKKDELISKLVFF